MPDQHNEQQENEGRIIRDAAANLRAYLQQFREGDFPLTFKFNKSTKHIFYVQDENARIAPDLPENIFDLAGHMLTKSMASMPGISIGDINEKFGALAYAVEKKAAEELNLDQI